MGRDGNDCGEMVIRISVPPGASPGTSDFEVLNPDDVFGVAEGMVSVAE